MLIAKHKIRLFSATGLVCIAVAIWTFNDTPNSETSRASAETSSDVDFFITNAKINFFDDSGQLAQSATSVKIEHFKQRQQSLLSTPFVTQYQNSLASTTIQSQQAISHDISQQITFNKNVVATSLKAGQQNTLLKTQQLTFDRKKNDISTEQDVEFTDTFGNIIKAKGLHADLNLKTLQLKNNVKGTYNDQ